MDFGMLGRIDFSWEFVAAFLSIVLIDLVLAGDNAVVIAMAVKNLPKKKRFWGIMFGAGAAVLLRVACTFVVSQLLVMQYVKLAGGAVIIWIGIKLLVEGAEDEGGTRRRGHCSRPSGSSWSRTSACPSTICSPSARPARGTSSSSSSGWPSASPSWCSPATSSPGSWTAIRSSCGSARPSWARWAAR